MLSIDDANFGQSDNVRSGRPRLVTQNNVIYIIVKESCSNCIDTSDIEFVSAVYIYFFLSHDLIALLNALFQKFDRR